MVDVKENFTHMESELPKWSFIFSQIAWVCVRARMRNDFSSNEYSCI